MRPVLTLLLIGFFATAAAADDSYFPLAKGYTWTYEVRSAALVPGVALATKGGKATLKVTDSRVIAGRTFHVLTMRSSDDALDGRTIVACSDEASIEVYSVSDGGLFLLPARFDGKPATAQVLVGETEISVTDHKVGEATELVVPAGTYSARDVSASFKVTGAVEGKSSVWYARGVGPVKMVFATRVTGAVSNTLTLELSEAALDSTVVRTVEPQPAEPVVEPAKDADAGLAALIEASLSGSADAARARAAAVLVRAKATAGGTAGAPAVAALAVRTGRGIEELRLSGQLVICKGDLALSAYLDGCIVLVDGDVSAAAYIKNCLVIATGDVSAGSYIEGSVVVARGSVRAGARIANSIFEAESVSVGAQSRGNIFVNTEEASAMKREDCRRVDADPGLAIAAFGK